MLEGISSGPPFPQHIHVAFIVQNSNPPSCIEFKQRVAVVVEEELGWMYELIAAVSLPCEMKLKTAGRRGGGEGTLVQRVVWREASRQTLAQRGVCSSFLYPLNLF